MTTRTQPCEVRGRVLAWAVALLALVATALSTTASPTWATSTAEAGVAVWVHEDTLTELQFVDGSSLTTTEDHPFWSVTDQRFEDAQELAPGEFVLTADGETVAVDGLRWVASGTGTAYNLTVADIHTYHVGDDAILVHNCGNAGDDVLPALTATQRRTLDDALRPDKLDHIFDPKHNFQPLVQQFGSREAAMEQIVRSIGGPLPHAGRFEIAQSIGGQNVVIRGAVVDGIPRIGTAFTP